MCGWIKLSGKKKHEKLTRQDIKKDLSSVQNKKGCKNAALLI